MGRFRVGMDLGLQFSAALASASAESRLRSDPGSSKQASTASTLSIRHTAVTNVYRSSRDLFLAQRFARHVSPLTTVVYTHPSDEELAEGVRELMC